MYIKLIASLTAYLAFTAFIAFIALLAKMENKLIRGNKPKVLHLSNFIAKRNFK